MSEMVERVGEALRKECLAIFGSTWSNDNAWRLAKAAIEAMRQPTPEMSAAGTRIGDDFYSGVADYEAEGIWEDMIDAALSDLTKDRKSKT